MNARTWARPVAIAAACVAVRLFYLLVSGAPEPTNYYWRVSDGLLSLGVLADGVPIAAYEPGYPVFLAAARWVTGGNLHLVLALQALVAGLGVALLYGLTLHLSGRVLAATVAALEFACYPYLIRQSAAFIEVTLFTTLVIASTYSFVRIRDARSAAISGGLLSLAILTRAVIAPLAVLWAGLLWLRGQRRGAVMMVATAALVVLPFSVMLYRHDGSFVPNRDGENLFVGNCEYADRFIPTYDVDFLVQHAFEVAARELGVDRDEAPRGVLDDEMRRQAVQFIREHPWRTLKLKVKNVFYLFQPRIVPYVPWGPASAAVFLPDGSFRIERPRQRARLAELTHGVVHALVLFTGLVGVFLRRRALTQDLPLWLALATVTAAAAVYFPTTRIGVPVMFVWMFYSGCALATLRAKDVE